MNLADLFEQEIDRFGEHVGLIYQGRQFTNVQSHQAAKRLANGLRGLGVEKGDRVIIQLPNCPEVFQCFLAVFSLGAVVVPINYLVGDAEKAFIYKDAGAKVIISNQEYWPKIRTCSSGLSSFEHIIFTEVAVVGVSDEVYGENIKAFAVKMPQQEITPQEVIEYCHGRLKRFKSPREVVFLDALPKNIVGKILRKKLREMPG